MAEKGLREQDICRMGSPEVNESPQRETSGQPDRKGERWSESSD